MPSAVFDRFRSEIGALQSALKVIHGRTVRNEDYREPVRTLCRTWVSAVAREVEPVLSDKREFGKLTGEYLILPGRCTGRPPERRDRILPVSIQGVT